MTGFSLFDSRSTAAGQIETHAACIASDVCFNASALNVPNRASSLRDATIEAIHVFKDIGVVPENVEHRQIVLSAACFLEQRFKDLGIPFPDSNVLVKLENGGSGRIWGAATATHRVARIAQHHNPSVFEAVIIHELSHALGKVGISKDLRPHDPPAQLSGTGMAVTRSGASLVTQGLAGPHRQQYFSIFEEGAATAHEREFYKGKGIVEKRISYSVCLSVQKDQDWSWKLARAALFMRDRSLYALAEQSAEKIGWCRAIVGTTFGSFSIPVNAFIFQEASTEGAFEWSTRYTQMNPALDTLARELYPDMTAAQAEKQFGDDLCRLQAGAPHAIVLKKMLRAFGRDATMFLARLEAGQDPDMHALSLFAAAGTLPNSERILARQLIVDAFRSDDARDPIREMVVREGSDFDGNVSVAFTGPLTSTDQELVLDRIVGLCSEGKFNQARQLQAYFRIEKDNVPPRLVSETLDRAIETSSLGELMVLRCLLPQYAGELLTALRYENELPKEMPALPSGFELGPKALEAIKK